MADIDSSQFQLKSTSQTVCLGQVNIPFPIPNYGCEALFALTVLSLLLLTVMIYFFVMKREDSDTEILKLRVKEKRMRKGTDVDLEYNLRASAPFIPVEQ